MGKAEHTVDELVGMIERGELRLPEMQRRYVWKATRVRDLLDSLYRGYPSGAILVWESDGKVPQREFAVTQTESPYQSGKLLLDGQQRLTSLSAVIRGEPVKVRGRQRPIDILFNLDHPDAVSVVTEVNEERDDDDDDIFGADAGIDDLQQRLNELTFIIATKQLASKPNWVSVTGVFKEGDNAPFLRGAGVKDFNDPRFTKYSNRLNRLRDIRKYSYRIDILESSLSYEEVTEIFVRVNSLGAKLRSSDLAMAQITAKWPESLKVFESFQAKCAKSGFDLELGIHLKNLVAFATRQSRFKVVANLPIQKIKDAWDPSTKGMEFALDFCESNARITSPTLLSSPFLLITLGYFGHKVGYQLSPKEEAELRYWLFVANIKGRYSRGSSETLLDQDLSTIAGEKGTAGLIDRVESAFGRLDILPADLIGRNQRSSLFKMMYLAFQEDDAKDWEQAVRISLSHRSKQHRLQFHHIFPKAVLKNHYKTNEINDICNLAFIGGKTNRRISKKPPREYLVALIDKLGTSPFDAQCIPTDRALFEIEAYPAFLDRRRVLVAERLNQFLQDTRAPQ